MKFHYDEKEDSGECVAIMTAQGNLMFTQKQDNGYNVTICRDGEVHCSGRTSEVEAVKRFYPGDKITIEF